MKWPWKIKKVEEIDSMKELRDKVEFFQDKIHDVSMEIQDIKKDFPFNQEAFLMDEEKVKEKQKDLRAEIDTVELILEMSEKELLELLQVKIII